MSDTKSLIHYGPGEQVVVAGVGQGEIISVDYDKCIARVKNKDRDSIYFGRPFEIALGNLILK